MVTLKTSKAGLLFSDNCFTGVLVFEFSPAIPNRMIPLAENNSTYSAFSYEFWKNNCMPVVIPIVNYAALLTK